MFLPIPLNGTITSGNYRVTFRNILNPKLLPAFPVPLEFDLDVGASTPKRLRITQTVLVGDPKNPKWQVDVTVLNNPFNAMALGVGMFTWASLAANFMEVDSIEKEIDTSTLIEYGALAIAGIFIVVMFARKRG